MGLFTSKLKIWNPGQPERAEEFELLVDTGAAYSWVPRARLESLGIRSTGRMQFRTIEGRVIEREVAPVFLASNGHIGGDTIVLAEPGDLEVFGAHSLEALGLAADPVQKKLMPTILPALAFRAGSGGKR